MEAQEDQPLRPTQPTSIVMNKFLEFMADILDVQQKLTDAEYKKLAESANALYQSCINDRQETVSMQAAERVKIIAMATRAFDSTICVIMRDYPWTDLTATKVRDLVAQRCGPSVSPAMIDRTFVRDIMDREIRLLVAEGRNDPAAEKTGDKRKR